MRGNHVLKVVAHASPPLSSQPGFRQYDFFVNGQSFFTFPKVFRLGLAPNDPRAVPGGIPSSASYGGGGGYNMAQRSSSYQRSRSDNIASLEAPRDQEEVRIIETSTFWLLNRILTQYLFLFYVQRKKHTSKKQSKCHCKRPEVLVERRQLPSRTVKRTCLISLTKRRPLPLCRKFHRISCC